MGGVAKLRKAASNGVLGEVQQLVDVERVDVDGNDEARKTPRGRHMVMFRHRTPLIRAACNGHWDVVRFLVDHGADVNTEDHKGKTPLLLAAESGLVESVKLLADHGANINCLDSNGATAIVVAAENGHINVARFLLWRGADIKTKRMPLLLAALSGDTKAVKSIPDSTDIEIKSTDGETPLMLAAENGNVEVVNYLATVRDAEVNVQNKDGETALHLAARNNHIGVVDYLITIKFAKVDIPTKLGTTPLMYAAKYACLDVVQFLASHGAAKDAKDKTGNSVLSYAFANKSVVYDETQTFLEISRCLFSYGIPYDKKAETSFEKMYGERYAEIFGACVDEWKSQCHAQLAADARAQSHISDDEKEKMRESLMRSVAKLSSITRLSKKAHSGSAVEHHDMNADGAGSSKAIGEASSVSGSNGSADHPAAETGEPAKGSRKRPWTRLRLLWRRQRQKLMKKRQE